MGMMPLVIGMPMRCTDAVDRKRKLFKHSRCKLVGWKLQDADARAVEVSTEEEYVLAGAPIALYV